METPISTLSTPSYGHGHGADEAMGELQGHTLEGGLPCFSPYETRHHDPCDGSLCKIKK